MVSISGKSASARLAEFLLFLENTYGITHDNYINIRLSMEELANLIGASKGYLTKMITEFNNNGWIYSASSRIKILDKDKLASISIS